MAADGRNAASNARTSVQILVIFSLPFDARLSQRCSREVPDFSGRLVDGSHAEKRIDFQVQKRL
jgi:hypothetical protein